MTERVKQRWIAQLIRDAQRDLPQMPWSRAAKRARRMSNPAFRAQSA